MSKKTCTRPRCWGQHVEHDQRDVACKICGRVLGPAHTGRVVVHQWFGATAPKRLVGGEALP